MPLFARTLSENWKLKLLALALAVLLWVVVSAEQVTSNWIPVPLQVRVNDPEFRLNSTSVPAEVEVRFSGPGRELWDLAIRRPPLVLSITDVDSTAATFGLDADMVQVPTQLAVRPLDVRPGAVTLDFRRVETRLAPVRVRIGELPGPGWTLVDDSLDVQPSRIRISGLAQDLGDIRALETEPIRLGAADSVFSRVVPLDTAGMRGVQLSATSVRVSGQVDRMVERSFPEVPVSVGDGVAIRPREVAVRLRGPQTRVGGLEPEDFRIVVSIDSIPGQIPPEGILVPIRAERLPRGVRAEISPGAVRLLPAGMVLDSVAVPGRPGVPADTADTAAAGGEPGSGEGGSGG